MVHGLRSRRCLSACEYAAKTVPPQPSQFLVLTLQGSLLTGMAASIIVSQKSWYNAHLTRQLYRTELENWGELKGLVLRFIDMQAATRQPRTQAVRALVNDIEIVVDPAEAWEQGLNLVPPGSR